MFLRQIGRCWIEIWFTVGRAHPQIWGSAVASELSVSAFLRIWNSTTSYDATGQDNVAIVCFLPQLASCTSYSQFGLRLGWNPDKHSNHRWHRNSTARSQQPPRADEMFQRYGLPHPTLKSLFWSGQRLSTPKFCFFWTYKSLQLIQFTNFRGNVWVIRIG